MGILPVILGPRWPWHDNAGLLLRRVEPCFAFAKFSHPASSRVPVARLTWLETTGSAGGEFLLFEPARPQAARIASGPQRRKELWDVFEKTLFRSRRRGSFEHSIFGLAGRVAA